MAFPGLPVPRGEPPHDHVGHGRQERQEPVAPLRAPRHAVFAGHVRIATVAARTREAATEALRSLGAGSAGSPSSPSSPGSADAAEVRLDALWPTVPDADTAADDLDALLGAAAVPLVATLRPRRQGGAFDGPEEVRIALLAAAAQAGFAAVDLEADVASPAVAAALAPHADLVLSHHAPAAPACDDGGILLLSMQDRNGALHKLAFPGASYADTLRALELARKHALRGGRPALATLGAGEAHVRALLALAGNRCTYGHAGASPPASPGQPSLASVQAVWDHWGLGKTDLDALAQPTPWLALLGNPVHHSLSPRMMNAALRAAGRPERYGCLEVPASAAALRLTCMVANRIGLAGASVTAPHKADALRMGQSDELARAVGAANCLRFGGDEPMATNTDATALRRVLAGHVDAGAPAVVLGSGGAARAAIWALQDLGATVRFTSRDAKRAQAVAAALGAKWTPWEQRGELAAQAWVQAATLDGSAPSPLADGQLRGRPLVVELVYRGGPTALQRQAAAAGCAVVDGRRMLLEQAVDAYRFWFGADAPRPAMEAALEAP